MSRFNDRKKYFESIRKKQTILQKKVDVLIYNFSLIQTFAIYFSPFVTGVPACNDFS